MHAPTNCTRLSFPAQMKPYIVGWLLATRDELRNAFGEPHFVETDSTQTFGGDEDAWAWELATGQRIVLVLQVPYGKAVLHCDPPNATPAIAALGIDAVNQHLELLATPIVDPSYAGP